MESSNILCEDGDNDRNSDEILDTNEKVVLLESRIERLKTDHEQDKFQLEKENLDLHSQLEEECLKYSEAQNKIKEFEVQISSIHDQLQREKDQNSLCLKNIESVQAENLDLKNTSKIITSNLQSKTKLADEFKEQIGLLEQHLAQAQKLKCEALFRADNSTSVQIQMQQKESRHKQEKSLMNHQMSVLQHQIEQQAEELLILRTDHSKSLMSLQSELAHNQEQLRLLKEERTANQKILNDQNKRVNELLHSLNEANESEARMEETFRQELAAQEKLSAIHKSSSEDQNKRCGELEQAIEELRRLLGDASDQYGAIERAKVKSEKDAKIILEERGSLIKELTEENDKINKLLRANVKQDDKNGISDLSPAATGASELLSRGMSLSQLYVEYLNVSEKCDKSEEENKRLSQYIDQILQEIEEKAPVLKRQRNEYERAMETVESLHKQIDDSIGDVEKQHYDMEEHKRRADYLQRDNDRLAQQCKDLGRQVSILVTEVEAARSGIPPPPLNMLDRLIGSTNNASGVIDQHLVIFRDVVGLQEQNQKLRASLRDVTEKMEMGESEAIDASTKKLKKELDAAQLELEELRSQRERMEGMVESLQRQRDVFKSLLDQEQQKQTNGDVLSPLQSPIKSPCKSGPGIFEDHSKTRLELEKLQKDLKKVVDEKNNLQDHLNKASEVEKQEVEKMRQLYEKAKVDNVRLLSQAQYNEERLKVLEGNCGTSQRKLNSLEESKVAMQAVIGRNEGMINMLREQCVELSRKLAQSERTTSSLREERLVLKENEARHLQELKGLQQVQSGQTLLLSNIEAIRTNIEMGNSDTRDRLQAKIDDLTEQNYRLRIKIESNTELTEIEMKNKATQEQLNSTKADLDASLNSLSEARITIAQMQSQVPQDVSRTPILNIHSRVSLSPTPLGPQDSSTSANNSLLTGVSIRDLKLQLNDQRTKIDLMTSAAEYAQNNINCMKKLMQEHEAERIRSSQLESASQEEISRLRKSIDEYDAKINTFNEKIKSFEEAETTLKETLNHQLMTMTEDLEERENELEEVQKCLDDATKAETESRQQLEEQSRLLLASQDKYEREVILHGADLTAIEEFKGQVANLVDQNEILLREKVKAEEAFIDAQSRFEMSETKLKNSSSELESRIVELEEQNAAVLEQFTQLSDKMSNIEAKIRECSEDGNASFTEEEAQSSDQLREIIKYLRREQQVYAGKSIAASGEMERAVAEKSALERQIAIVNKHLADEREKNKSLGESSSRYTELMLRVQTMDALADSNKMLRDEKQQIKASMDEAVAKLESFMKQIEPLQLKVRDMNAQIENLNGEIESLEEKRDMYKTRCQELVDKLNKARPEDMLTVQQNLVAVQKDLGNKDIEINRLKHMVSNIQRMHQMVIADKNQMTKRLTNSMEESKTAAEESKKAVTEKIKIQDMLKQNLEKVRHLEISIQQLTIAKQQEQRKNEQIIGELNELKKSNESLDKDLAKLYTESSEKDKVLSEMQNKQKVTEEKLTDLTSNNLQLKKIAMKYKKKVEKASKETGDEEAPVESSPSKSQDKLKEYEERHAASMHRAQVLEEENKQLKDELGESRAREEEYSQGGDSALRSQLESKYELILKTNAINSQLKASIMKVKENHKRALDESHTKIKALEKKCEAIEREKENLSKMFQLQSKQIELMQKQAQGTSKGQSTPLSQEKVASEPPPTANIKPMASPIAPVSSPRSQGSTQSGSGPSRSIPTASVKPMAPPHSGGEGAVSSTVVTLPQATVTPTPAVTSTASQSFPTTLTATVSPTPVSTSLASTSPFAFQQQMSGSSTAPVQLAVPQSAQIAPTQAIAPENVLSQSVSDDLISQALALVMPQGIDRMDADGAAPGPSGSDAFSQQHSSKRKHDDDSDIEESQDDEPKRSRIDEGEERGEPSSSSSHLVSQKAREEGDDAVMVLSSDEEEAVPSSQGGDDGEDEMEAQAQREDEESDDSPQEMSGETPGEARPILQSSEAPRPIQPPTPSHEHPSSSSRPQLSAFSNLQYEESDDRLVPSTPTFLSRPIEGTQNDSISSVQVPSSQGFVFDAPGGSGREAPEQSHEGLGQLAESGLLDITRTDLHFSENQRPVPQSLQRIQESTPDGNISSSGGEGTSSGGASHLIISTRDGGDHGTATSEAEAEQGSNQEPDSGLGRDQQRSNDEESELQSQTNSELSHVESSQERSNQDHSQDSIEEQEEDEDDDEGSPVSSPRFSQEMQSSAQRRSPIAWGERRPISISRGSEVQGSEQHGERQVSMGRAGPVRGPSTARRSRPGGFSRGGSE